MKKKLLTITLLAISGLVLTGCTPIDNSSSDTSQINETSTPINGETPDVKTYTLAEIAMHSSESDCWMAIDNVVVDVTSYINSHPGGKQIVDGCGKDATAMFKSIEGGKGHSNNAFGLLDDYYIGELAN